MQKRMEHLMKNPKFPKDKFNRKLVKEVFPKDWKNPPAAPLYDLVVIGAGPGGMTAAVLASNFNLKIALIEKHHMGGECLIAGCIPSKALLRSSRTVNEFLHANEMGVSVKEWEVNFPKIMERVRNLRSSVGRFDEVTNFQKMGIDVFLGNGEFTSPEELKVDHQTLRFKKAILATGTEPAVLDIPGLKEAGFLTNQTVFNLTSLPKRLAMIGAGPLSCELSQAFNRFGSQVTIITHGPSILSHEDDTAREMLQEVFENEGIRFFFSTNVKKIEKKGKEKVLTFENMRKSLAVDEILMAVGRTPAIHGYGLEKANVIADSKNGIAVNDLLQTSNPNIFSIGDMEYKFTHISTEHAKMAVHNAFLQGNMKKSSLVVPWCTFTDPEIAHVGMTESEMRKKGIPYQALMLDMADVPRAILDSETRGFFKLYVKEGSDQILGATLMSSHAGEMLSEITVAITSGGGLSALTRAIHPFPTQSEVFRMGAEILLAKMAKNSRHIA